MKIWMPYFSLSYVQQLTDLLPCIKGKYFICMYVPLLVGMCQNKAPFGIWTSAIHYRKRGAAQCLMEYILKMYVCMYVQNKSVLHACAILSYNKKPRGGYCWTVYIPVQFLETIRNLYCMTLPGLMFVSFIYNTAWEFKTDIQGSPTGQTELW